MRVARIGNRQIEAAKEKLQFRKQKRHPEVPLS